MAILWTEQSIPMWLELYSVLPGIGRDDGDKAILYVEWEELIIMLEVSVVTQGR